MVRAHTAGNKSRILTHLRKLAPFSTVERGIDAASKGAVSEFSGGGNVFSGVVKDDDGVTHSAQLRVVSSSEIEALCSCSSPEEMQEQWCSHAVSLLWCSVELDFFAPDSGFGEREATIRVHSASASEVATAIRDIQLNADESRAWSESGMASAGVPVYTPEVTILLDFTSDRLGVKVLFDDADQEPTVFEGFKRPSSRALDNILLQVLEDEGSWDETNHIWYINSSKSIELILGIIQEYPNVRAISDMQNLRFVRQHLNAQLLVTWHAGSVDLAMQWIVPSLDGTSYQLIEKTSDVFGTGPFWSLVNHVVYRLSPHAARIASLFGHAPTLTFPRSQVGPILETIEEFGSSNSLLLVVQRPELQPTTEIRSPLPALSIERKDISLDHFTSSRVVEIQAVLDFQYPPAPKDKNVVYLPDRNAEAEAIASLTSLGFEAQAEPRRFLISGDAALDFINAGYKQLKKQWKVTGLDVVQKTVRFADLNVSVLVTGPSANKADSEPYEGGNIDWFSCSIALSQNNSNIPLSAVFKNAKTETDRWTRLDSGVYAKVPGGNIGQLKATLGMIDPNCRLSNTIKTKLSLAQAISLSRLGGDGFSVQLDKKLSALAAKLDSFSEIEKVKPSKGFSGKLRKYQEEGVSWLNFLHQFELGGILADEMGLGKTVQALAFFQHLIDKRKKSGSKKPILIVAPTSVITNWSYEIKKFTPELESLMLHGPQRKQLFPKIPEVDFVLTSYALLRLDRYDLERYEFSYLVLDEAQNIKNPTAATTKAAKSIRAKHRLALTGTPTENRPMELWSIMDFLMPGYLGSHEFFRTHIERPILEGGPSIEVGKLLNGKTRPFIMRRIKAEVEKELPPKMESVLHVEMTPSQQELYKQILEEVRPKVLDAVAKKGVRGASVSILAALLRLRQVCNHPNSIDALSDVPGYDSGKFLLLKDLVTEALENGRKILLFSQFRAMLGIIRTWMDEIQTPYLYLDGTTKNRQDLIDRFTNDESIRLFLISLKAGGSGLNLMAADTVIIYDPWWNPAVESQAVDRAHRIGQNKAVTVYRLVTEDSVEQKIMDLKSKKSKLVDALINENGLSTVNLSKNDLESLFSPLPVEGD